MNKQELTGALAETLRTNSGNAERLASQFILLGTKYRKNLIRKLNGEQVDRNLEKTEAAIKNLCDRLALSYRLVDDVRGPSLRLFLDNGYDSLAGGYAVEDNI